MIATVITLSVNGDLIPRLTFENVDGFRWRPCSTDVVREETGRCYFLAANLQLCSSANLQHGGPRRCWRLSGEWRPRLQYRRTVGTTG